MFSTRNRASRAVSSRAISLRAVGVLAAASLFAINGCQRVRPPRPDRLSDAPLVVDEAMQIRDWDRSTAVYANGATVAGATRLTYESRGSGPLVYAADPLIGLGNFILIPFTYFHTPPFKAIEHHGAIVPPTHTAMPISGVIE